MANELRSQGPADEDPGSAQCDKLLAVYAVNDVLSNRHCCSYTERTLPLPRRVRCMRAIAAAAMAGVHRNCTSPHHLLHCSSAVSIVSLWRKVAGRLVAIAWRQCSRGHARIKCLSESFETLLCALNPEVGKCSLCSVISIPFRQWAISLRSNGPQQACPR